MPAFNTLIVNRVCGSCGRSYSLGLQFKYGSVWQRTYGIGDTVVWGKNDVGHAVSSAVLDAASENQCPNCGIDAENFYVFVTNNVFRRFEACDGEYSFSEASWLKLEEKESSNSTVKRGS